jgi:hypothetical protein
MVKKAIGRKRQREWRARLVRCATKRAVRDRKPKRQREASREPS